MFGFLDRLNPFHRHRQSVYYVIEPDQMDCPVPPPPHEAAKPSAAAASSSGAPDDDAHKKSEGGGFMGFLEKVISAIGGFFGMIFKFIAGLFGHHEEGQAPQSGTGQTPPVQDRPLLRDGPAPAVTTPQKPAPGVPAVAPDTSALSAWPSPVSSGGKPSADVFAPGTAVPASKPAVSATAGYTVPEKLKLSEAVNQLSLISFKDPNPAQGSANAADYTKLAGDLAKLPNISLYDSSSGHYKSIQTGDANELSAAIAADTDKRFRVDFGDGKSVYLQQVAQTSRDESPTGFAGGSFRIVDEAGKPLGNEALMGFPGYTGKVDIGAFQTTTDGSRQSNSMQAIAEGKLNPQAPEALKLASDTFNALGPDTTLLTAADSMGTSNMRVAGAFLKGKGVNVQEISLEPVADSQEVSRIKAALGDSASALHQQFAALGVSENNMAGLVDQASKGGIDLRSEFQKNGQSFYTAEAGIEIGRGLLPGMDLMDIASGAKRAGVNNDTTADTQLRLNITRENFAKPELDGHTGVGIMQALMHNDDIAVEKTGIALQSTMTNTARIDAPSHRARARVHVPLVPEIILN